MNLWNPVKAEDIHFELEKKHRPASLLAFLFMNKGDLLWVRHPERGWEVPGGKVEPGEAPLNGLRREVFEETGATILRPQWVAEYKVRVTVPSSVLFGDTYKWVYFADVDKLQDRPANSEILEVRIAPAMSPAEAQGDPACSPIMKDAVYEFLWPRVQDYGRNR